MIRLTAVIDLEGQGPRALTHESNARVVIIGRDADADFQIPLTTVSRQHIKISETDGVYIVEDMGSTHGSLLNGKKLVKGDKKVLRDGDIIELTKARITCNVESEKVVEADASEGTQAIASKAVAGILGRLGEGDSEGPFLRVLNGADEGQRFSFHGSQTEWAMGRSKDCEFVINDANVSRRHGIVKKDWNGFLISDLGSKNGVVINGRKIKKPRRLKDRDEITIGPIKLVFIDPDAELMAALSDVPGFETEDESEELEEDPSVMGAPQEDGESEESDGEPESEEEIDEYASIDPALLEGEKRGFPTEWLIVGLVGLMITGFVILLYFMFAG